MACFLYQLNTLSKSAHQLISHGIGAAYYHSQSDNEYILNDFNVPKMPLLM